MADEIEIPAGALAIALYGAVREELGRQGITSANQAMVGIAVMAEFFCNLTRRQYGDQGQAFVDWLVAHLAERIREPLNEGFAMYPAKWANLPRLDENGTPVD